MSISVVYSAAIRGIEGQIVTVESTNVSSPKPRLDIIGLPDAAIKESQGRVRSAARACDLPLKKGILTVNLARSDIKKEGTQGDTPQLFAAVISICTALMPHCTPVSPSEVTDKQENTALACLEYIRKHYREKITLQQLADHVHLHPNYLCDVFKRQTGHTVMEHLAITRVDAAKFLLRRDS